MRDLRFLSVVFSYFHFIIFSLMQAVENRIIKSTKCLSFLLVINLNTLSLDNFIYLFLNSMRSWRSVIYIFQLIFYKRNCHIYIFFFSANVELFFLPFFDVSVGFYESSGSWVKFIWYCQMQLWKTTGFFVMNFRASALLHL